jgi:hypothetical protein
MNKILLAQILFFSLLFPQIAWSKTGVYVALAPSYTGVSAVRLNIDDWEFGYLTSAALGFNKVFRAENTYSSFGIAFSVGNSLGFFGSAGVEYSMFLGLNFRAELFALMTHTSYSYTAGQLGVSYYF